MTELDQHAIRADVLARLLLVQSTAGHLPDETAIVGFVCRGLEMVPGVTKALSQLRDANDTRKSATIRAFPMRFGGTDHGSILLELDGTPTFQPYEPHVQNLLFVVAVMLEERRQRRLTEAHQHELEMRVEERTRQLTEEIRVRRSAEAKALAEMHRAEGYLAIAEAIIVELDVLGKIHLVNQRGCDLLGYSASELFGQDWFEIAIPSPLRSEARDTFNRLMSGDARLTEYHDSVVVTKAGALLHVAWHDVLRFDDGKLVGTLSSGVNITDRKRSEDALAAEKDRLAVTLRSIGDGVITTDTAGRVVVMNPVAEKLTGWLQSEAQGRLLSETFVIIDERTQLPCENPVTKVLATASVVELANHTLLIARNGTRRAIADSGAPIRDRAGETIGVVLVFRDVTEKHRLTEQLQRAERLDAIGVLAAGIAHDFNNLLSGIFGYICLARDQATDGEPQAEALDEALRVFERAKDLTQQLLTFSKGGKPVRSAIDLRKLVADCVPFSLSGSNVSCKFQVSPDIPSVEVDGSQIWRVIDNLIRNAVQAMPLGGTIVVGAESIEIGENEHPVLVAGKYVKVTVADSGPGIPSEIQPRIFDPFFTTKEGGSGLGLATAYSVIKKHHGHIEVRSQLGQGSSFQLYLPAAGRPAMEPNRSTSNQGHRGKGRALVMDDEPYLRSLFEKYLSRMGYRVATASNGEEALLAIESASAAREPFTVALIDLTIPGGMGGKEVISLIRERCPEIIAIASSGYSDDPIMSEPREFGFTASIGKPFAISELAAVLETCAAPAL